MYKNKLCQNEFGEYTTNGEPIYISKAEKAFLYDQNKKQYIDFHNGYGTILLGYDNTVIRENINKLFENGLYFVKSPTNYLFTLKDMLLQDYSDCQDVAFYTTGTSAVRAAVCATLNDEKKKNIILSAGFHGWDPMWENAKEPFMPNCYGIINFFFILDKLEELIEKYHDRIAAVVISPDLTYFSDAYYRQFADIIKKYNLFVIEDGVKVGYRYWNGSFLKKWVSSPMMYIASKCISNGARVSVVVFPSKYSRLFSEYVYTTLFDTSAAVSAISVLKQLHLGNIQKQINQLGTVLLQKLKKLFEQANLKISIVGNGNLFQFIFPNEKFENAFFDISLEEGLFFFRSDNQTLNACFTNDIVDEVLCRLERVTCQLIKAGFNKYETIPDEMIIKSAFTQTEGCPEKLEIDKKLSFVYSLFHQ